MEERKTIEVDCELFREWEELASEVSHNLIQVYEVLEEGVDYYRRTNKICFGSFGSIISRDVRATQEKAYKLYNFLYNIINKDEEREGEL